MRPGMVTAQAPKPARPTAVREVAGQAGRFAAVGVFNTLFGFAAFNALLLAGMTPIPAHVLSVTVGMVVSFLANRAFVFKHREGSAFKQALAFFATTAFGMYVLQTAVILLLLDLWTAPFDALVPLFGGIADHALLRANAAKVVATGVSLTWNFLAYRYLVFRKRVPSSDGAL